MHCQTRHVVSLEPMEGHPLPSFVRNNRQCGRVVGHQTVLLVDVAEHKHNRRQRCLSIYLYLFHNKPYSTTIDKNNGTGRTRLTALTAAQ